ncbi:DNA primase small subunit-like [Watersipora subatra]|uniref:DNA primase small subunit-like n=1 Tax=Watersipora subatra TaxID=2589382 RepID=UPI00355C84DA
MEKDIKTKCPHKIDLGAVYTCSPKMRDMVRAGEFVAQYKELVFDIDMTDYDDVRTCCSGASICLKCWPLMTMAMRIIHRALTEDFGFKHLLWVYSGRRGVHCWVCDERARKLGAAARGAVAEYLSLVKGGNNTKKKVVLKYNNVHPSVRKSLQIISEYFEDYVTKKQDLLSTPEKFETIKGLITDDKTLKCLKQLADTDKLGETTVQRWAGLKAAFLSSMSEEGAKCLDAELYEMPHNMKEIMLQYAYPRLDVNVSTGVNHLLKSPFCIHPKTGRVCVPIDINKVEKFDPFQVPTLHELTEELAHWKGEANLHNYKKTSLRSYIATFDRFLKGLTNDPVSDIKHEKMDTSESIHAAVKSF